MSGFDTTGSGHIPVGGPLRLSRDARYHFGPDECTHSDGNVCAGCAELTEAEAAALIQFTEMIRDRLQAARTPGGDT